MPYNLLSEAGGTPIDRVSRRLASVDDRMARPTPSASPAAGVSVREDLLTTKVSVPRIRPDLLPRPHLTDRITGAMAHDLILVCTPAGFGKTTLLAGWAETTNRPVAWLSLDDGDNDPARFWRYVIAALDHTHPGIGGRALASLGATSRPPGEAFITTLINELAAYDQEIVLVLDDYHVIETRPVHDGLTFLLNHLPPRLRLVIAGRGDPPLPLAGLRARGRLAELRAADLRFTGTEVAAFFQDVWGLRLPAEAMAAIEERTEGWAAGLQLAALSLRDQPDPAGFITAFTGSHRFVLDYLSEEVLARQPEEVRAFLLATAVLERLCGSLCDAVTERTDGQRMLETVERTNLFLVPLDDRRHWYRYHHLFADLLRVRLGHEGADTVAALHRRAAAWYETNGLTGDAVHHALAAGDAAWAVRLIEQTMEDLIWWRGESATLARWLAALPEEMARARPRLSLARALQALVAGRLDAVDTLVAVAEHAPAAAADEPYMPTIGRARSVLANVPAAIAFMHASLAGQRGQAERAAACAREALWCLTEDDHQLRAVVQVLPAEADWLSGRLPEAEAELEAVIAARQADGQPQMATRPLSVLGQVQQAGGRLRAAEQTYRRGLAMLTMPDRPPPSSAALQHVGLAEVLRQQGNLDAALQHATAGIELCRLLAGAQPLAAGLATLAWVRQALGDPAGARAAADEAVQAVQNDEVVALLNPAPSERARLLLAQGETAEAAGWAAERGLSDEDTPSYPRERDYLVLARLLLARGAPGRTLKLLDRIVVRAATSERMGSLIEALTLQALALDAAVEPERALAALTEALTRAQPEGYVRVFADEGAPMAALLRRLVASARRGHVPPPGDALMDYVLRLLGTFPAQGAVDGTVVTRHTAAVPGLVEPLTEREHEVLLLLAAGKANREIAGQLVVTLDTVKKHLTHIFGKLGAASRTQAIARARELGLLP